jgi:uncharacterized protein YchJ
VSVGCAMIVRDGEATIEITIASVRPHVDQVAVWVDERTSDDTLGILERLSALDGTPLRFATGSFEWFAQARNESFALVDPAHDWIVWLDDDVLIGGENLRGLTAKASELGANWIAVDYDYADLPDGPKVLSRPRVARVGAARWEGAIHEDLVPIPSTSRPIVSAVRSRDLCVRHLRRDARPGHYLDELLAATADLDRTPHAFLYLGTEYMRLGQPGEADAALRRYVTERHDLRGGRKCAWARLAALTQLANAREELGDAQLAASLRAQVQTEQRAEEAQVAKLRRARLDTPARGEPQVGRNDPCWCGSGKKLKRCHGA